MNDSAVKIDEQLVEVYKEICQAIKTTDETSFKLLGTVPLMSGVGSGGLILLEKTDLLIGDMDAPVVIALSLIGAAITVGLFKWELRTIKKCNWLVCRAAELEKLMLRSAAASSEPEAVWGSHASIQFIGEADPKDLEKGTMEEIELSPLTLKSWDKWGKTEAERLIYTAAIAAWGIPLLFAAISLFAKAWEALEKWLGA